MQIYQTLIVWGSVGFGSLSLLFSIFMKSLVEVIGFIVFKLYGVFNCYCVVHHPESCACEMSSYCV